jgi:hypothetical protein
MTLGVTSHTVHLPNTAMGSGNKLKAYSALVFFIAANSTWFNTAYTHTYTDADG